MKILISILTFFIFPLLNGQDFNELVTSPYNDYCPSMIVLDNNNFVTLQNRNVYNSNTFEYFKSDEIDDFNFSSVSLYNQSGSLIKTIQFGISDTLMYLAEKLIKLKNGNLCAGGTIINSYTNKSNHFFSIYDESLNLVEFVLINSNDNRYFNNFIEFNNGFVFLDQQYLFYYSNNGDFKNSLSISNLGCATSEISQFSLFEFNNFIHIKCLNSDSSVLIDTNFYRQINSLDSLTENSYTNIGGISRQGNKLNNNCYLYTTGITLNDSIPHNAIIKIDSLNNHSIFYSDTTNTGGYYTTSTIDNNFKFKEHIYYVFNKINNINNRYFLIYSLDSNGNLNWRKYIYPNTTISALSLFGIPNANSATNDKGFIFTITYKDLFDNTDIYYLKLDSLGNKVDLPPFVNSIKKLFSVSDFFVYPNPVKDFLSIETFLTEEYDFFIYNIEGRKILESKFKANSKINISDLNVGNYYYKIMSLDNLEVQNGRFIKK